MALNKQNQLTKDKEFDNVFKKGRSSYDFMMGVKSVLTDLPDSRFGILVSTKISKKAVDRNRIKRRIREVIGLKLDKIKPGYDIVIITLPPILKKEYQEIEKSLDCHFSRLRLFQK